MRASLPPVWLLAAAVALSLAPSASATNNLFNQLPNQPQSCNTCHANGPGSERNAFGLQVEANIDGDVNTGTLDWASVCGLDADDDGSTNGAELGDPCCTYTGGTPPSTATANPNDASVLSSLLCEDGMVVSDEVPDGWTCPGPWFGASDGCDCGCGVVDDDCPNTALGSCESNGCPDADDGDIPSPQDPTLCVPATGDGGTPAIGDAPDGWTCNPGWFGNGDGCDCGCGVVDDDCADDTLDSCESNGCPDAAAGEVPDPDAPTQCVTPTEGGVFDCAQTGRGGLVTGLLGLLALGATRARGRSSRSRRARG